MGVRLLSAFLVIFTIPCFIRGEKETPKQVFLGGSCDPTTWRKDTVIPQLESKRITYFNPQVDCEWHDGLIQIEEDQKATAELLFFFIDTQTRAIASLVEVAFLAGADRKLIPAIKDIPGSNAKIGNDVLSAK